MIRRTLAAFVVVGAVDEYPEGSCVAWMDVPDRVCGKPADILCPRHEKVAARRANEAIEAVRRCRAREEAKRAASAPQWSAELDRIEAELDRIDPLRREATTDTAVINTPLSTRLPSDSRIERLARLHDQRATLRRKLGLS